MALKKIEKALSNVFENTFSKVFPSDLEEVEITNNLTREIESTKKDDLIPHNFTIIVSKPDYESIKDTEIQICLNLEEKIIEYAKENEYTLRQTPQVKIEIKNSFKKGMIKINSTFKKTKPNRIGYLIINNKYKKLKNTNIIGRGSDNQIVIPAHSISRNHAQILHNNGIYIIEDLGSTNGTFINSAMVKAEEPQQLKHNDVVKLGDEEIIFKLGIVRENK